MKNLFILISILFFISCGGANNDVAAVNDSLPAVKDTCCAKDSLVADSFAVESAESLNE